MTSLALSIITLVVIVWCALTAYVSYRVMSKRDQVLNEEYVFAISCLVIACVFIIIFAIYAYNRESGDAGSFGEQSLVSGFRWYDAAILFILVAWCALSIAISSILIREFDEEQAQSSNATKKASSKILSSIDRDVAISTVVFAVVVLVQYITFLIVQDRLPNWCQQFARVQEEQRKALSEILGSTQARQQQQPQYVFLPQMLTQQAPAPKKDEFSLSRLL
jgi:predicted PurR-regulated permease PerM